MSSVTVKTKKFGCVCFGAHKVLAQSNFQSTKCFDTNLYVPGICIQ